MASRSNKFSKSVRNNQLKSEISLIDRTRDYLRRKNLETEEKIIAYGVSGIEYDIDFLLTSKQPSSQRVAVLVRDYKGPAKVTNIHQAAHLQNDCREIDKVLLVSNSISGPADNLAKKSGIQTLLLNEIIGIYLNEGWSLKEASGS